MTEYEKALSIRRLLLIGISELHAYKDSWSKEYQLKSLGNVVPEIIKNLEESTEKRYVDVEKLTKNQMLDLGFRLWSEEHEFLLIPLWILPFLPERLTVCHLDGESEIVDKGELDNDHRGGMLAYGIMPSDGMRKQKALKE